MSEMRRLAALLVARRPAAFESVLPRDESVARLRAQVASADPGLRGEADGERAHLRWGSAGGGVAFEGRWVAGETGARLDGMFVPVGRTQRILQACSAVLMALLAGSAFAWLTPGVDSVTRVLLPITTLLAILAFPFVAVALGSHREAQEAQIARAIRQALGAETAEQRPRPRQKWADEED